MSRDVVRLAAIAAVLVVALIVGSQIYLASHEEERAAALEEKAAAQPALFERPHSRSLGPDDAPVTIVEFLDPECESCRLMHPYVKRVLAAHPDDVRLVLRYMPLHGNSVYAAGALEAAGEQGMYWEMLDTLFAHQPEWGNHQEPRPELIPEYARELGLDMARFERFLASGAYRELVETDRQDGIALGVRGTPTFFVDEKPLPSLGYAQLKAMVEQELARK